jgi:tetratricopeptide (TPR) repeat protein
LQGGRLARLERRDEAVQAFRRALEEGVMREAIASNAFIAALALHEAAPHRLPRVHPGPPGRSPGLAQRRQPFHPGGQVRRCARRVRAGDSASRRTIRTGGSARRKSLVQAGRRVDAIAAYREALRVRPGYIPASARLERVQKEIGREQSDSKAPQ